MLKRAMAISLAYAAVDFLTSAIFMGLSSLSHFGVEGLALTGLIAGGVVRFLFGVAVGLLTKAALLEIACSVTVALMLVTSIRAISGDWGWGALSSDWWLLVLIAAATIVLVLIGSWGVRYRKKGIRVLPP